MLIATNSAGKWYTEKIQQYRELRVSMAWSPSDTHTKLTVVTNKTLYKSRQVLDAEIYQLGMTCMHKQWMPDHFLSSHTACE